MLFNLLLSSWAINLAFKLFISCSIFLTDFILSEFIILESSLNYFLLFYNAAFLVSMHFFKSVIYFSRSLYLCSHYFTYLFAAFSYFVSLSSYVAICFSEPLSFEVVLCGGSTESCFYGFYFDFFDWIELVFGIILL